MTTPPTRRLLWLAALATLLSITTLAAGTVHAQADKPGSVDQPKSNPDSVDAIVLPNSGSTSTAGTAWSITNNGGGRAGYFSLNNTTSTNPALEARTTSTSASALGVMGQAAATQGGSFSAGVRGYNASTTANGYGVIGTHNGAGTGMYGYAVGAGGRGVYGYSPATSGSGKGVHGQTASAGGYGGFFINTAASGTGVYGSGGSYGVYGSGPNFGVTGYSSGGPDSRGVFGFAPNGNGVRGESANVGVYGRSNGYDGDGVVGENSASSGNGVRAIGNSGIGVFATGSTGVYGAGTGWAAYFFGNVTITGSCSGCGGATAQIDHPLDSTKYVEQADVLASERLGIANGNIKLDAKGEAIVKLPAWFNGVYGDYRYTLTALDAPGPNLYVTDYGSGQSFKIAGGGAGMKVSWQVSGVRQDKYAKENPLVVEGLKSDQAKPALVSEEQPLTSMPEGVEPPAQP